MEYTRNNYSKRKGGFSDEILLADLKPGKFFLGMD